MGTDCEGDERVLLAVQAGFQCDGSSSAAEREREGGRGREREDEREGGREEREVGRGRRKGERCHRLRA